MRVAPVLLFALLVPSIVAAEDQLCGHAAPVERPDPNARVIAWMSTEDGYVGLDDRENVVAEANPWCPGGPYFSMSTTTLGCIDPCTGVNLCVPDKASVYPREIPVR